MNNTKNTFLAIKSEILISVFLSFYFIVFLWGFWSKDVYALGVNFSIYLGAVTLFFVLKLKKKTRYSKSDLAWIIPLLLMALSFALYENPFFKPFNLVVFPFVLALFYIYSWIDNKKEIDWNFSYFTKIILRAFSFFIFLKKLFQSLMEGIFYKDKTGWGVVKRITVGLVILLISLLLIVPLLSSADPLFAEALKPIFDFVANLVSPSVIGKFIVFVVLTIVTLTSFIAWGRPQTIVESREEKMRDMVTTGIALGGIFAVYLLFLWVQIDRLWVGALPFDFNEIENLVKSGFWQLLFLSFVNLAIFFFLYHKTISVGQKMLGAFSVASILLLTSSAYRMGLYVTYYGFSYEKFYASYTVLFCALLFIWLISRLFVTKKSNVIKFLAFQFLWMFALVSVFPVEQFILRTNMNLVKNKESHINLYEMEMLSSDVLEQIEEYKAKGLLEEKNEANLITNTEGELSKAPTHDWDSWILEQENKLQQKKWYEFNLSAVI